MNFSRQPSNGIQITTWKDDVYDTELLHLQYILLDMVREDPSDVREFLNKSKEHGLLPKHFLEPSYDSSMGSFAAFEAFAAKDASGNPLEESTSLSKNVAANDTLLSVDSSSNSPTSKN